MLATSSGGRARNDLISYHCLYLDRVQTGELAANFALVFKQFLPHRGWFDIAIPAGILFSQGGMAFMADAGCNIRDGELFRAYVRAAIDDWHSKNRTTMTYEQFGWKDDDTTFLYGSYLYSRDGKSQTTGSEEMQTRAQWVGPSASGSVAAWRENANALFAAGTESQSVAVCAGFGAPLMKFLSPTEGGAIISFVTPDTGRGKTTAALGAITIWAQQRGLEIKTEFSKVVRGLTLAACGNLPVMNDELRARDPVLMRDYVLMFTGGGDKPRASRDGHIRHAAGNWQTILITTDNYSLVDLLSGGSEIEDAAQMRVIELTCSIPPTRKHIYGASLSRGLQENAGWAGDAYLQWLVQPENLAWTKAELERTYRALYDITGWDERHRFWVRTIACCAVGGKIAVNLGLVDFSVQRIVKWLIEQLADRAHPKEKEWEVPLLAAFLDAHVGERLLVLNPYTSAEKHAASYDPPRSGRLSIRYEANQKRYLIATRSLKEWVTKQGRSFRNMVDRLEKSGICVNPRQKVTLGAGTPFASGQVWAVAIDAAHPAMSGIPRPAEPDQVLSTGVVVLHPRSVPEDLLADQIDDAAGPHRQPSSGD